MMDELLPLATQAAALLKQKKLTIAIAESSSGGLIAAALLAVPGASAYFVGGAVLYTRAAHDAFLAIPAADLAGLRAATEPHTLVVARRARERLSASLCLAEHGCAGPTGNRYGDAPGHSCFAIAGPFERSMTIETGRAGRAQNMHAFAKAGLTFLVENL